MRRFVRMVVAVSALGLVGAGAAYLGWRGDAVDVVRPERGPVVQTVVSSGRVLPPAEIRLGALTASTVADVKVAEGDVVTKGQLLLRLDDGEARAAVEQAEATLTQAKAGRYEQARLSGPAAAAQLEQAAANLEQAERRLKQAEELFAAGATTRTKLDEAKTAVSIAKSQHEAAQLQVKATRAGGSQALRAAASVAVAEAQLAQARELLSRTRIVAPADGVVTARHVEPGDAVVVGSRLLVLSRRGATRLVIEPDERNLALIALGQSAIASAEAFPNQRFDAEVAFVAPTVDPERGTVEVRLAVAEPPGYLRPHMTVSVEIEVGRREEALTIPRSAVRGLSTDQAYAFVVVGQKVERRPLELGLRGERLVEVLAGVDAGEALVADASADLETGQRIRSE